MIWLAQVESGYRVVELYATIGDKKYFNLSEVASLCGVTPAAALYWCRQGTMRNFARTSARGTYRIPRREVVRVLGRRRVEVPGLWTAKTRILVMDDCAPIAKLIRRILERAGIPVELRASRTVGDGLVLAGKMEPEIIFVDYGSPCDELQGMHALAAIRQARLLNHSMVVGMASAPGCEREMRKAGAQEFLGKPLDHERLVRSVVRFLRIRDPRNPVKGSRKN